jgi:hypothetical protein
MDLGVDVISLSATQRNDERKVTAARKLLKISVIR